MFNLVRLGLTPMLLYMKGYKNVVCFKIVHIDIVNCLVYKSNRWKLYLWFNVLKNVFKI